MSIRNSTPPLAVRLQTVHSSLTPPPSFRYTSLSLETSLNLYSPHRPYHTLSSGHFSRSPGPTLVHSRPPVQCMSNTRNKIFFTSPYLLKSRLPHSYPTVVQTVNLLVPWYQEGRSLINHLTIWSCLPSTGPISTSFPSLYVHLILHFFNWSPPLLNLYTSLPFFHLSYRDFKDQTSWGVYYHCKEPSPRSNPPFNTK